MDMAHGINEYRKSSDAHDLVMLLIEMGKRITALEARIAGLEGEQQPAPVLINTAYTAIPAPDIARAVVCIQRALQIVEAHNLNIAAENLTESLDMLTGQY